MIPIVTDTSNNVNIDSSGHLLVKIAKDAQEVNEWRKDYIVSDDYIESVCASIENEGWTIVSVYPVGGGDERLAILSKRSKAPEKKEPIGFKFQPAIMSNRKMINDLGFDIEKEQALIREEREQAKYWSEIHKKRAELEKRRAKAGPAVPPLFSAVYNEDKKVVAYDIETSGVAPSPTWMHNCVSIQEYEAGKARMRQVAGLRGSDLEAQRYVDYVLGKS